jgi:hypothetical protein
MVKEGKGGKGETKERKGETVKAGIFSLGGARRN